RVVERVQRRHRHVEGRARRRRGRGADREVAGRGGADRDRAAGAGDRGGDRVGDRQRLAARRLERHEVREGVGAVVAGGEGVVRRQRGLAVAAGEVDRARVAAGRVAVLVEGVERDAERRAGRGGGRGGGEGEALGCPGVDNLAEGTGGGGSAEPGGPG